VDGDSDVKVKRAIRLTQDKMQSYMDVKKFLTAEIKAEAPSSDL
jgi:hypothetical protein